MAESLHFSSAAQRRFLIYPFFRDLFTLIQPRVSSVRSAAHSMHHPTSFASQLRSAQSSILLPELVSRHPVIPIMVTSTPKTNSQIPHLPATSSPEIQLKRLEPRPHPPTPRTRSPRHPAPYPTHLSTRTTKLINTIAAEPTNTLRASPTLPQQPHPPTPSAVDLDFPSSSPDASAVSEGGGGVAAVGGEAGGVHVEVLA